MPTIREILQARNELAVHYQDTGTVTEDDLMRICYNQQVEEKADKAKCKQNRRKAKTLTYLSSKDREAVIVLTAITQTLDNVIKDWDMLGNRPTFVLSAMRTAQTMTYKVIEWMLKEIPQKDYLRVLSDVGYYQIGIYEYTPKRKVN